MNEWFEAEQRVERAHELYESGRWEDALRELRAALRVNPYQGEWHFNMGLTLDAMGRHEEAIECFERALEYQGADAEVLNNLGLDLLRLQQPRQALRRFEQAAQVEPDQEPSYSHRITAYAQLGDHEQAELMFYMACQLDEHHPRPYYNVAMSLLERRRLDKAIWCLNRVRRLDPGDGEVHARLAEAYWLKGEHERARRQYLRQLRLVPGDTQTLMDLGGLLMELGRPTEAAEKYRRVTELEPGHAEAHFALGCLSLDAGDLDAAQMAFELVLRLRPRTPQTHQKLAAIALRRSRVQQARRHLRAELAATDQATEDQAAEELAGLLLEARMPSHAAQVLTGLTRRRPTDPRLAHQLALARFADGRMRDGIRAARHAVRNDPAYLIAMHNLALANERLGRLRHARYWAHRALRVDPEDARVRQLQSRLWLKQIKRNIQRFFRPER